MQARLNPTLHTLVKVQTALEKAPGPVSRYQIHRILKGSVNYPVLDAVITYFAALRLVLDEGKGGKVLWVHNIDERARSLFRRSRRVA